MASSHQRQPPPYEYDIGVDFNFAPPPPPLSPAQQSTQRQEMSVDEEKASGPVVTLQRSQSRLVKPERYVVYRY
jgi:hypothetical protein